MNTLKVFVFNFIFLCGSVSLLFSMACQSKSKKDTITKFDHPPAPADYKPEVPEKITSLGENRFPSLSYDSQLLLYVSAQRDKHNHQQVYLLNLQTKQEKRITFQNGRIGYPQFIGKSLTISYLSTTDSDKEAAFSLKAKNKDLIIDIPPTPNHSDLRSLLQIDNYEIYVSNLVGSSIERLTQASGFDGGVYFLAPDHFVYASETKKYIGFREAVKKKNKWLHSNISTKKDLSDYHSLNPHYLASSKKWTWLQVKNDFTSSRIAIGDQLGMITTVIPNSTSDSFVISPTWHPSGNYILFSSNIDDKNNFELYVYDFSHNCLKRLTYLATAEIDPTFSPDGQFVYFSSDLTGASHIFRIKFSPSIACSHHN